MLLLDKYRLPLSVMLLHALLAALWNVAGLRLISQGQSPLGPTASWEGVGVMAVLIILYLFTLRKGYEKSFLLITAIGALLGAMTIYGALTKDHSLWSSEFWRVAGIAVNSLAVIGFVWVFQVFTNVKKIFNYSEKEKKVCLLTLLFM